MTSPIHSSRRVRAALAVLAAVALVGGVSLPSTTAVADILDSTTVLPAATRLAGTDRYAQSVEASRAGDDHPEIVYVASGEKFADALSAASVAAIHHSPLLLTQANRLPAAVAGEIGRLEPATIVVVGGTASVSDDVMAQLSRTTDGVTVTRIDGADRYEVSRRLIAEPVIGVPDTHRLMLVTGTDFPDALSASSPAAHLHAPVLLVNGSTTGPSAAEQTLFTQLALTTAIIVGGTNSVSAAYEASFAAGSPTRTVYRVTGDNRYATSVAVNKRVYSAATTVYLASGQSFPDALSGGALAGAKESPLYVVPQNCVPQAVLDELTVLHPRSIVLLGGIVTLNADVQSLTPCS